MYFHVYIYIHAHHSAWIEIIALWLLLLSNEIHVIHVHVEKRSSSSGSCEDGRGVGEEASKKRPRVIGPTMPPQAKRDVPEQVCHVLQYTCH